MFVSFCIMFGFGGGIVIEQGQAYFLLNLTSSSSSNHKKSETEDGVSSGYVSLEILDSKEKYQFPMARQSVPLPVSILLVIFVERQRNCGSWFVKDLVFWPVLFTLRIKPNYLSPL